jgi:hypothetical protein
MAKPRQSASFPPKVQATTETSLFENATAFTGSSETQFARAGDRASFPDNMRVVRVVRFGEAYFRGNDRSGRAVRIRRFCE